MSFFAVGEGLVIQGFGLQAGIVILALVTVIIYRERYWTRVQNDSRAENKALQDKVDSIQEERLQNAIETRDKLAEPMENMAQLLGNILNVVTKDSRG